MVCIYCGSPTSVVNSRHQRRGNTIWRRRKCSVCAHIFTTVEQTDLAQGFMVRQASSKHSLKPFSRDRLFTSLYESCKHRPSALTDATSLTQLIIGQLLQSQPRGLILREDIARQCYTTLQKFDHTAMAVYLAYHPAADSDAPTS